MSATVGLCKIAYVRRTWDLYCGLAILFSGDSMAYNNGRQFDTAVANDGFNLPKCDDPLSGGWWFNGCLYGNLNARYGSIYWYYVLLSTHSLKATEMKIPAM